MLKKFNGGGIDEMLNLIFTFICPIFPEGETMRQSLPSTQAVKRHGNDWYQHTVNPTVLLW